MIEAKYDAIAQEYHEMAKASFQDPTSINGLAVQALITRLGNVEGKALCDLGCGDGHLANHLSKAGAKVLGLDISEALLSLARQEFPETTFKREDGQSLSSIDDASFELVVSNFALMDMPDLQAVYQAVWRVLKANGHFVFTITHPCFQAPHSDLLLEDGMFSGRVIKQYRNEGAWKSSYSKGIRGRVGANHRHLSTYLNGLLQAGFALEFIEEPLLPLADYATPYTQSMAEIPAIVLIDVRKF